jgi:hypothetical protein
MLKKDGESLGRKISQSLPPFRSGVKAGFLQALGWKGETVRFDMLTLNGQLG